MRQLSADDLYREELLEAQAMKPEDKLLEGARLFDRACSLMVAGIRHELPGASDQEVLSVLERRLDYLRQIEVGV